MSPTFLAVTNFTHWNHTKLPAASMIVNCQSPVISSCCSNHMELPPSRCTIIPIFTNLQLVSEHISFPQIFPWYIIIVLFYTFIHLRGLRNRNSYSSHDKKSYWHWHSHVSCWKFKLKLLESPGICWDADAMMRTPLVLVICSYSDETFFHYVRQWWMLQYVCYCHTLICTLSQKKRHPFTFTIT